MNARDEIVDAMEGRRAELPPPAVFTSTATVSQMDSSGCSWPEANFDPQKLVGLSLEMNRSFGFGSVRLPFSIAVEAKVHGCEVAEGKKDTPPMVLSSPYAGKGALSDVPDLMPVDEFLSSGWVASVLQAAELMNKHEEVFKTVSIDGPFSVAEFLAGAENMIMGLLMEPALVDKWIFAMVPYQEAYASRVTELCDNVMVIEEADTSILPPEYFDQVIGSKLPGVILKAMKSSFCSLHSCGDTIAVVDELSNLGEDLISCEASESPRAYTERIHRKCKVLGSVNPIRVLMQGTPLDVLEAAAHSVEAGFDLIGPECGVSPLTSDENLMMLSHYRERLR